jgi:hypothetical protein
VPHPEARRRLDRVPLQFNHISIILYYTYEMINQN